MSGNKPTQIAWDSCVFLAWFKQEADKPLDQIEMVLKLIEKGRITLVVSAICAAEVLNESGGSDAGKQLLGFIKRDNVIPADADMRIAELAARMRESVIEAVK